jgi:ABC-type uncharacterized transport system fused permease/ATPase subunit
MKYAIFAYLLPIIVTLICARIEILHTRKKDPKFNYDKDEQSTLLLMFVPIFNIIIMLLSIILVVGILLGNRLERISNSWINILTFTKYTNEKN